MLEVGYGLFALSPFPVLIESTGYSIQHVLVAERLGQEVDGSGFHSLHRHRNVAMPSHKDDRDADSSFGQNILEFKTADPGQPNIKHETADNIRELAAQQFSG